MDQYQGNKPGHHPGAKFYVFIFHFSPFLFKFYKMSDKV